MNPYAIRSLETRKNNAEANAQLEIICKILNFDGIEKIT